MAHYEDLEVDQGASARWQLQLTEADGHTVRDLAGFVAVARINNSTMADSAEVITMTANITAPPSLGIIDISLSHEQTQELNRRRYIYDVQVEYYDSDRFTSVVERILEGNLMISRNAR